MTQHTAQNPHTAT